METKMKTNKFEKCFSALLCVLLAACIGMVGSAQLIAKAAEEKLYLEDIQIGTNFGGFTAQSFIDKGYKIVDNVNLNVGTDTGKDVYLAYKTTTNKDLAIRDIKLMAMDSGYTVFDYNDLNEHIASQNAGRAQTFADAAKGFAANYLAGSPRAIDAYNALNLFRVEQKGTELLGDYIVAGKADQAFFSKMLVESNAQAINAIIGFINIGLTPYLNEYDEESGKQVTADWASLIPLSELWQKFENGITKDEEIELDKKYNDIAKNLFHQIQDFTTYYENAVVRAGENYENLDLDLKGDIDDAPQALENAEEKDMDVAYIICYEKLNQYDFDESTKLGDWFLSVGRQTSDKADIRQLYPVIDAMGENQACIVDTGGLISAVFNLTENEHMQEIDGMIKDVKDEVKKIDGNETLYVFDNRNDDFETYAKFAVTADANRQSAATNPIDRTSFWWDDFYDKYYPAFSKVSFILGAVYAVVGVVAIVSAAGVFVTTLMATTCVVMAALNTVFTAIFTAVTFLNTWGAPFFSLVSMAVTLALFIFMFANLIIQQCKKIVKAAFQTEMPDYIVDTRKTGGGEINVLYECVRNDIGKVQDINAAKQWKWVVMSITRDPRVGSPIEADKNGNFFKQVNGNGSVQNGYDSVKYFGDRTPADLNAYCEKNQVNGCYLHYRTENSLENINEDDTDTAADETLPQTGVSYLSDIVVSVAPDAETARNRIMSKSGKYLFDQNLSPDQNIATYIGYSLTDDPKDAITDIRVVPNVGKSTGSNEISYGDVKYIFSHVLGFDDTAGGRFGTPTCDALYFAKDEKAGDPIPVDSLTVVSSLSKVGADSEWIPVSYLGNDQPYNFDTSFYLYNTGEGYNAYWSDKDNYLNKMPSVYLYYKPVNARSGGTKYLSGIFFSGGYDDTPQKVLSWLSLIEGEPEQLREKLLQNKRTQDAGISLSHSIGDRNWGSNSTSSGKYNDIDLRLYYTWTYYPKRALTNIAAYQGDTYSTSLPYSMSKPLDGVAQNFVAAVNFQQQYGIPTEAMARFVMPGNVFRNSDGCVWEASNNSWQFRDAFNGTRTDVMPDGIPFGYKKAHFLPTALYLCGPVEGKDPLRLDDVIICQANLQPLPVDADGVYHYQLDKVMYETDLEYSYTKEVSSNGRICTLEPDTTLSADGRKEATGDFRPVVDIKNPHSLYAFNLSYPDALDSSNKLMRKTQPCYIYLRGQKTDKQKYISSLSVGAYSRTQFKKENPDQKENLADSMAEGTAMFMAASGCADETIIYNVAAPNQSDAWYNRQKDGVGKTDAPENVPAAYIGVTRTDDPKKAITGVLLYQLDDSIAPGEITCGGIKYTCAGTGMPIIMNGKRYFLYYSRNAGDAAGLPIEDVKIDTTPIISGYATNLCADKTSGEPYGNPSQTAYIHTKYSQSTEFFNKLYIGRGRTKKEAMCDLLSQGCIECIDIDLNQGIEGNTILLGYRSGRINQAAIDAKKSQSAKDKELALQTNEAIYDIVVTCGEPFYEEGIICNNMYYHPVAGSDLESDLNGWDGDSIHMYYASPYYSEDYNFKNNASTLLPQDVYSGCITKLAFAESDRVPYNTALAQSDESENIMPWEYVMQSNNEVPADLNQGAVSYSPHHAGDIRISMFAQRMDGSVKPSGEITGGFLEETYAVGNVSIK